MSSTSTEFKCKSCGYTKQVTDNSHEEPFLCERCNNSLSQLDSYSNCGISSNLPDKIGKKDSEHTAQMESGKNFFDYIEEILKKMIFGIPKFIFWCLPHSIYLFTMKIFPLFTRLIKVLFLFFVWILFLIWPYIFWETDPFLFKTKYYNYYILFVSSWISLGVIGSIWGLFRVRLSRKRR